MHSKGVNVLISTQSGNYFRQIRYLTTSEDRGILVRTLIFLFCRVWGSNVSSAFWWPPTSSERISGSSLWRAGVMGRFMSWVGRDVDILGDRRHKLEMRRKLKLKRLKLIYRLRILCSILLCFQRHVLPDGSGQRMTVLLCDCDSTLFMMWCGRFSLLLHNFLWFWWTWNCTERCRCDGNFRHTVVVTR